LSIFPELAKKMRLRVADFRRILRTNTNLNQKLALRNSIVFASTGKMLSGWPTLNERMVEDRPKSML